MALCQSPRAQPIEWHPSAGESRGRRGLDLAAVVRGDCPPDEREYYFWPGTFASNDEFFRERLTRFLRAAGQESLTCGSQEGDSQYRFTWLRTFRYPVVVRVWSSPGTHWLDGRELDGAGGYEPGAPMTSIRRRLNEREWRVITAALARAGFWGMVTEGEVEGEDGANRVLEGRRGNAYHVVHRWSADDGPFSEACLTLLRVAGLVPVRDIY